MTDTLLKTSDVLRALNISRRTLERKLAAGEFRELRRFRLSANSEYRYRASSVDRLIDVLEKPTRKRD